MEIKNRKTGEIIDVPTGPNQGYATTIDGEDGAIIIDNSSGENEIFFIVDDAVDQIKDTVHVKPFRSLDNMFTFDLTEVDPDEPEEAPNCSLMQLLESTPPSATLNTAQTRWILRLVPADPKMVLQYATELNGITKAGAAIVNIVYNDMTKNPDGSYSVEIANSGNAETVLLRQKGCTSTIISPSLNDFNGGRFHAYKPSGSGGELPTPIEGKINVPIGAFNWPGFYDDYLLTPRQGIDGATYDQGINATTLQRRIMTEFNSENIVPFFGRRNLPTESVPIITNIVWNPVTEVNDLTIQYKDVTIDFNESQTAMDKQIAFALDAGIDYFAFLWYSPYDTPMGEAHYKFSQSMNKGSMKMCFTSGPIGWDISKNIDYMTNQMMQGYYQKIDGKPLFFCEVNWPHLNAVRAAYATKSGGGELYVTWGNGYNDYPSIGGSAQASSIYNTYPDRLPSDTPYTELPHSRVMDLEKTAWQTFINNNAAGDIVPCITTGAKNFNARHSLHPISFDRWFANPTSTEMATKLNNVRLFINANPTRCKTIVFYSWNENTESGNPLCPVLAAGYNSVNVASLGSGENTGVDRSQLNAIKPFCKK